MRRDRYSLARSAKALAAVAFVILASRGPAGPALAAETAPLPSIEEMLRAIGLAPPPPAVRKTPGAPAPVGISGLPGVGEPEATLTNFDSLLKAGDYKGARALVKARSRRLGAGMRGVLDAADGLVDVFVARRAAMTAAAEARIGQTITVYTASGRRRGEVRSVSDDGFEIVVRTIINGQVRSEKNVAIAWGDLVPKEQDRLAQGWTPEGATGDVARAALAAFRKDVKGAEQALLLVGAHPLAGHYKLKVAAIKEGVVGLAARLAWEDIERSAAAKSLKPETAQALLGDMDAYAAAFGKTRFFAGAAERIRLVRAKIESAMGPSLGLVGHWSFDEGRGTRAQDSCGKGAHATFTAAPGWGPGVIGNAAVFDGSAQAVVAQPERFNLGTHDYTVSTWVRTSAGGAILSKCSRTGEGSDHSKVFALHHHRFYFNDGGGKHWLSAGPVVDDGEWHHLATTFSDADNVVRLYVDGVPESAAVISLASDGAGHPLTIGAAPRFRPPVPGFTGALDELRIYSRALPAEEVAALARAPGLERRKSRYFPSEQITANFVEKDSMKPYPVGTRFNHFPACEVADPSGPFHGRAVYFDQRTGKDVVYSVRTVTAASKITVRMAAMKGCVIEVFASYNGEVIGKVGPLGGGNTWGQFEVEFPGQRGFAIRIHNDVSTWLLIDRIFVQ